LNFGGALSIIYISNKQGQIMQPLHHTTEADEFITIVGADISEITREYHAQGLAERQYAIVHQAGKHRFTRVIDHKGESLFDGAALIAATFRRRASA